MIYLIGQLAIWLLLAAAFAAMAGWAFAAERAAPLEEHRARERDTLVRDLIRYAGDGSDAPAPDRNDDASLRLLDIRDARIAELERHLETARARADELSGELAEQQRRGVLNTHDADELARLRALEEERARTVDAEVEPVEDENAALQEWRLRYFEQRVRYLESIPRTAEPQVLAAPSDDAVAAPMHEWVAREASERAAYLENELRALRQAPPVADVIEPEAEPFAANADVDMLLRWRMLYLERRVAHLQAESANVLRVVAPEPAPVHDAGPDPDRWKWRARYLEARVRHLEQRPAPPPVYVAAPPTQADTPEPVQPVAAPSRRAKPAVLASARNGAPDDLTLIEGVSLLQQTTLYSLGVFHFDQIAAWSEENVAWVDQYLRLQGRIEEQEWVEQASDLAREGPAAARRVLADEDV